MSVKSSNIVTHNIFGEGVILETRWDGAESRVKFKSGLCLWLPTKWLKPIQAEERELDKISAKRILEAFRMGVVPHQDIEYFTFGRAYEIDFLQKGLENLKDGSGGVYLVEGGYGSGKTHLLEYARHLSLRIGLVTSCCELHIQETPPYRPKRIYHELVYNLRYIKDDYEHGYRDLLRAATRVKINDHCFLTPVLRRLKEIDDSDLRSEVFWQWIEGESTKEYATDPFSPYRVKGGQAIPALYDFSTAADFYNYILSGLSFLINYLGLGGLVIILDEFETIEHIWDSRLYQRGLGFLEGLIGIGFNDAGLKSINNRMMHNQVRPTPYAYKESYILLILATTPSESTLITERIENKIYLRRFSRAEFETIFDNLLKVYKFAHQDFMIETNLRENIFNAALKRNREELRDFIKFCVEAFDWVRLKKA